METSHQDPIKKAFLFALSIIILYGVVMVYSASYIVAKEVHNNSTYFVFKQAIFLLIGLPIAWIISKTKIEFWVRYSFILNLLGIIALLLSLVGPMAFSAKGSSRWVSLMGHRFQPAEMVKYSFVLYSIYIFQNYQKFKLGKLILHGVFLALPLAILIIQPDFGSFFICLIVISYIAYLGPIPRKWFYGAFMVCVSLSIAMAFMAPYRVQRMLVFLDPWKDPKNTGFQIIQSFLAFANGAFWGKGIGNSTEKLFYLPEAHNDFIFSVLGEEQGFVGVLFCVLLYLSFIILGFCLAIKKKNTISGNVISGIIFAIGVQAFLNMAVVLGLLPTKGLNLPFMSSGGSSLLSNLIGIGFLLSAYNSRPSEMPIEDHSGVEEFESRYSMETPMYTGNQQNRVQPGFRPKLP